MKANIFHIQGNDSLQSVQNHFKSLFPSMQICFFRDPDKLNKTDQCIMYSPNVLVNGINSNVKDLAIEITPNMRVVDLENIIKSTGLHAQISCRILNRRSPASSVSNWLLRDVYHVDEPYDSNKDGKNSFITSKSDKNIKLA
jgi:hypothetical protein